MSLDRRPGYDLQPGSTQRADLLLADRARSAELMRRIEQLPADTRENVMKILQDPSYTDPEQEAFDYLDRIGTK